MVFVAPVLPRPHRRGPRTTVKHRRVVSRRLNILSREAVIATPTDVKPRSVRFPAWIATTVASPTPSPHPTQEDPSTNASPLQEAATWYTDDETRRIHAENQSAIATARAFFIKYGYIDSEDTSIVGLEQHAVPGLAELRTLAAKYHVRRRLEELAEF